MPLGGSFIGGDSAAEFIEVPFTFATASPVALGTRNSDEVIVRSEVVITTPFDGGTPSILLGTNVDPDMILAAGEVKPKKIGQYQTHETFPEPASDENLELTIVPSGSTAGAGYVTLTLWRP